MWVENFDSESRFMKIYGRLKSALLNIIAAKGVHTFLARVSEARINVLTIILEFLIFPLEIYYKANIIFFTSTRDAIEYNILEIYWENFRMISLRGNS